MSRSRFTLVLILALAGAGGCARYQYELVAPGDLAGPIAKEMTVPAQPLEYTFADLGERLYVRLGNPTDDLVELAGGRSYTVDPRGESRAMGPAVLAPHSFIDFALPPSVPVVHAYPRYGFGYGYYGHHRGFGYPYDPRPYPPYAYDYNVSRAPLWDWTTGEVRLHLSFERRPALDDRGKGADGPPPAGPIEQEFVFLRRRVE